MQRDLDIVIFGATGDTGVIGCCCLFFQGKKLGISKWAPAARNLGKLQKDVLDRFANAEPGPDGVAHQAPIQADSGDYASLVRMCARAKCVVACAGPFLAYGEGVVRACVETSTNYVDVTGEIPWVEKMQRKYGEEAEKKGISIVSCAGYDSVPPDLSTFLAAKALEKEGESLCRFEAFVGGGGGALPSGTLNTVTDGVDEAKRRVLNTVTFGMLGKKQMKEIKNEATPLVKSSGTGGKYVPDKDQGNLKSNLLWTMVPGYSSLAGQFCFPHFMAPINVNVVHHTAAKEGYSGLVYRERMGGLPNGLLSLYGLIPSLMGCGGFIGFGLLLPLPYITPILKKIRDIINTPLQQNVRNLVFSGFKSTGTTTVRGFGVSNSGRTKVRVDIDSEYDPGLGFTMLSACTVASQIVKRAGTSAKTRPGFNSAVCAVGGLEFADALREMGVKIDVSTQGGSKL